MRRTTPSLVALVLAVCMGGCAARQEIAHAPLGLHADTVPGTGVTGVSTLIEPDDGVRPLVRALDRAQNRMFMESYILTDTRVLHALERAAAQRVNVYVMLEPHPLGMGTQPQHMADLLRAAGIAVRWSRTGFALTHAKFLVLDDRLAIISTANFSRSAFRSNREMLVFDRRPSDVRVLSNLFRRDWDRTVGDLDDPNLVVSPANARAKLAALIARSRHSIALYAEEIADPAMERLLVAAARRRVRVQVILAWGATPAAAARLARGGVEVRELRVPYIHAKLICLDGREAFVGSENLSTASLDSNREVGLLIRGSSLHRLLTVFARDWQRAVSVALPAA